MTTIPTSSDVAALNRSPDTGGAAPAASPQVGAEFNNFLKLLTAQIRNQDPLAPMDSTQFVEQLATFSALEQQVQSNSSLGNIAAMIGELNTFVANEWLGSRVSVETSWLPYAGEPVEISFDAPEQADRATLTVSDAQGNEIWKDAFDPQSGPQVWNGQTLSGGTVANDTLVQLQIRLYDGKDLLGYAAPRIATTVTDVASEDGTLRLGTRSNLTAELSQVRRLDP